MENYKSPVYKVIAVPVEKIIANRDRKSTRLNSSHR